MIKCKMITTYRPSNLSGGLRTNEVVGMTHSIPKVGASFKMISTPLTEGTDVRCIETNRVKSVEKNGNVYTFQTDSGSEYKLEVIETEEKGE